MPWMLLSKEFLQNHVASLHHYEADFKVAFNSDTVKWSLTFEKMAITRYCSYHGFNELLGSVHFMHSFRSCETAALAQAITP